jgi:outer membrane lipoprotein carrier protein
MKRPGLWPLLGYLGFAVVSVGALTAQDDPWASLRAARQSLSENSPLEARFTQTFTPAGFSTGESESGSLYLALPDCLRWDYEEPYPRSYLLCGDTIWAWSPDEEVGDRIDGVSRDEAGLDFLLLSVDKLSERYSVATSDVEDESLRLDLDPLSDEAPFRQATLRLAGSTRYPLEISYRDAEGNRTLFELSNFRPSSDEQRFTPPSDIEWIVNE